MPSAIVVAGASEIGAPFSNATFIDGMASACTPMIRMSGLRIFSASAIPAIKPPPPTGTMTASRLRILLVQFKTDSALTGDDRRIIERMKERQASFLAQPLGFGESPIVIFAVQHGLCAVSPHRPL